MKYIRRITLRLLYTGILTVLVALNLHAQDEVDSISYSLNLPETVVLADGMTFEEYLLRQVLANAKPLKEKIARLDYSVACQVEKDIDLSKFPHRRTITFAARLAGYGPIVSALREHKHFGITMAEDAHFDRGRITTSNTRIVEMKQQLTDKQKASFLKHDGMLSVNVYDKFYKKVRQKVKQLQRLRKKQEDTGLRYKGSYTAHGRTIYIVELHNMNVHIADGCWQITRISYLEGQNNMHYEFKEVRPNLFLLSHGRAKLFLDRVKWPKGYITMNIEYAYR
jgi:hypothetical protein